MTINSVAQEISDTGYGSPGLRDEVYIQLCKQVSDNPRRESLRRGWELLGESVDQINSFFLEFLNYSIFFFDKISNYLEDKQTITHGKLHFIPCLYQHPLLLLNNKLFRDKVILQNRTRVQSLG